MKLGSFVKEDAICSTKNCRTSGEFILCFGVLTSLLSLVGFDFVKSSVMVGPHEAREVEHGTEPNVRLRLEPDVASICEGCGWLCSPS